jgi:type II secretory pathway component PulK
MNSWKIGRKVRKRRGAVILAALVCLLVVVALLGALLQGTLQARRQLQVQRDLRQCELLADAGIERAAHRLTKESDYRGETWSAPAQREIGLAEGRVTIALARAADDQPWQASITAEYPLDGERSIRRTRKVSISLPSRPTQE